MTCSFYPKLHFSLFSNTLQLLYVYGPISVVILYACVLCMWREYETLSNTKLYSGLLSPVASAPANLMAVQEGPTSIRVSWSPPNPLGDTTGYRIYYSDSDSSDSVDVSGGSTDNYILTGIQNGDSYTISIVATSQHLTSESVTLDMVVGLCKSISILHMLAHQCRLLCSQFQASLV